MPITVNFCLWHKTKLQLSEFIAAKRSFNGLDKTASMDEAGQNAAAAMAGRLNDAIASMVVRQGMLKAMRLPTSRNPTSPHAPPLSP